MTVAVDVKPQTRQTKNNKQKYFLFFQESLECLFSACGKVDRVYLHKKPTAGLPERDKSKFFPTVSKIQVCIGARFPCTVKPV